MMNFVSQKFSNAKLFFFSSTLFVANCPIANELTLQSILLTAIQRHEIVEIEHSLLYSYNVQRLFSQIKICYCYFTVRCVSPHTQKKNFSSLYAGLNITTGITIQNRYIQQFNMLSCLTVSQSFDRSISLTSIVSY